MIQVLKVMIGNAGNLIEGCYIRVRSDIDVINVNGIKFFN